jgi:hypothetical protein
LYEKVATREDGLTSRLSPSLVNACNPLLQAHPPWVQDNTSRGSPFFPLVFHLAPTHLGWDTQRQFTRRSRDPRGQNADNNHVVYCHSRFPKFNVARFHRAQNIVVLLTFVLTSSFSHNLFSFSIGGTFGSNIL